MICSRWKTRTMLLALGASAAAAAALTAALTMLNGPSGTPHTSGVKAVSGKAVGVYSAARYGFRGPTAIVADGSQLWVANGNSVTELNAADGRLTRIVSGPGYGFSFPDAIAVSAALTAMKIKAKAIVCLSTTGKTATMIAGSRPRAPILSITHQIDPLNRMELVWGIQTYKILPYQSSEEALTQIEDLLIKIGLVERGDKVVVTMGTPVAQRAKTNSIRVYTVTQDPGEPTPDKDLPLRRRKDLRQLLKGT